MTNPILQEYQTILGKVSGKRAKEVLDYIANCLNPDAPSHLISRGGLLTTTLALWREIDPNDSQRYEELGKQVDKILEERGYRDNIYTWQEHKIIGSTVWIKYSEEPHKPIGIIMGEFTVEEANRARQLAKRQSAFGQYFGLDDLIKVSLEPLDENGNTVRDPRVLDDKLEPVPTQYSPDFPFKRA